MSKSVREIRFERGQIWDQMQALHSVAGERKFSTSEQATWDQMNARMNELDAELKIAEEYDEHIRQMAGGGGFDGSPILFPVGEGECYAKPEPYSTNIATNDNGSITRMYGNDENNGRETAEYRGAFWQAMSRPEGLVNQQVRALSIGNDPGGGYLCPTELDNRILVALTEAVIMRQLGTVIITQSDHDIPVGNASGSAAWTSEGGSYIESDETFSKVNLKAYKAGTIMKVSEELLADVVALESYIFNEYTRRISLIEEEAFINGNGVGKPGGVVGSATLGVTGSQVADMTPDDAIDLFYSLPRQYRVRASWLMNDATVRALRKKKATTGDYVWQPGLGNEPDKILGRPLYTSGYMPEMAADAKSVLFGDFGYYRIAQRTGTVLQKLVEKYAETGHVGYKAYERVDGRLVLPEAVVYFKNANS